ncbi:MAG: cytochrome c oxidase assembly protein [Sandaracinaceae bacterium]|nr:cytochrome c oxidase assembly protein [Sandaracinaceae bacterium]
MTAAAPTTTGAARAPRSTLAWIGLFAAPLAWAVHIGARYPLVRFACDAKQTWALHAVSLGCALAAGAGLACAIVAARRARPAEPGLESDADVLGPSPPAARRVGLISVLARAGSSPASSSSDRSWPRRSPSSCMIPARGRSPHEGAGLDARGARAPLARARARRGPGQASRGAAPHVHPRSARGGARRARARAPCARPRAAPPARSALAGPRAARGGLAARAARRGGLDLHAARRARRGLVRRSLVQHLLLVSVAAPLAALARPGPVFAWAWSPASRRALARALRALHPLVRVAAPIGHPAAALALHAAAVWIWHLPGLYEAALLDDRVHALEHAAFFLTAWLFWRALVLAGRRGGLGHGAAVLAAFAATLQGSGLGAVLTSARAPWYRAHAGGPEGFGLTLLEDQQLAGLAMWVPGGGSTCSRRCSRSRPGCAPPRRARTRAWG